MACGLGAAGLSEQAGDPCTKVNSKRVMIGWARDDTDLLYMVCLTSAVDRNMCGPSGLPTLGVLGLCDHELCRETLLFKARGLAVRFHGDRFGANHQRGQPPVAELRRDSISLVQCVREYALIGLHR